MDDSELDSDSEDMDVNDFFESDDAELEPDEEIQEDMRLLSGKALLHTKYLKIIFPFYFRNNW